VSEEAFTLEHVTLRRAGATLLSDVCAAIPGGGCTALAGPSGAGKSTLLRLLNRLDEPTSGQVRFHGTPLPRLDVLALRRRVGLVGQQPVLLTDTVLADLRVGAPALAEDAAATLLARAHLPPEMLHRGTAGLSGGEAQRVCLARALAVEPEVLLLDEPTSSLDAASAAAVEDTIGRLTASGQTIVLVSHSPAQARRLAVHAVILDSGRVTEQGPIDTVAYLKDQP
jgi:putative ABC transport system ATP-binding protein